MRTSHWLCNIQYGSYLVLMQSILGHSICDSSAYSPFAAAGFVCVLAYISHNILREAAYFISMAMLKKL